MGTGGIYTKIYIIFSKNWRHKFHNFLAWPENAEKSGTTPPTSWTSKFGVPTCFNFKLLGEKFSEKVSPFFSPARRAEFAVKILFISRLKQDPIFLVKTRKSQNSKYNFTVQNGGTTGTERNTDSYVTIGSKV